MEHFTDLISNVANLKAIAGIGVGGLFAAGALDGQLIFGFSQIYFRKSTLYLLESTKSTLLLKIFHYFLMADIWL